MNSICIIGARGGSKGVKRKNIRSLAGKPLIAYSIQTAIESKMFKHVLVSTEDKEIAGIAKKYGAEIPFMRPKKLATDNASMVDVLIHAIKKCEELGYKCDCLVNRDCTVPLIRKKDIISLLKKFSREDCNGVFAVYRQHLNPYFNMMECDSHGFLKLSKKLDHYIKRRQDAPIVYQLNGLFAMEPKKLLKYNTTLMPKILPYEIPPATGLMIDTEAEFQFAELIIKKKLLEKII